MKYKILLLIIVGILLMGASYKLDLWSFLNEYEEECYEYEWYDSPYCVGYWSKIGYENINGSWEEINLTESVCKCAGWSPMDGCLQTIRLPNESNCLKYHLVRKVKNV